MVNERTVLYIGGFELPDKNAAAQRVIGLAKGLKAIGYNVIFLNSIKGSTASNVEEKEYFGFKCFEYQRENASDYILFATTSLAMISRIKPSAVFAYNYPAVALNRIRLYCKSNGIKCYADVTEWYVADKGSFIYRLIKNIDTTYRMKYVHKKLDGIVAISRFLYNYYNNSSVRTVLIPPTVDISDKKWNVEITKRKDIISFVYAGSPSVQKERLDIIVKSIEKLKDKYNVTLNIVGITKKQFKEQYLIEEELSDSIIFWGRLEHQKVLRIIKSCNWSIILRDNNRVVNAGFPTKLVESISCGTPVIVNKFSNVEDYLDSSNSIIIEDLSSLTNELNNCIVERNIVNKELFDFHQYLDKLKELMRDCY